VEIADDFHREFEQDIWDMRRFFRNFPLHNRPSIYIIDFTTIPSAHMRSELKRFYRAKLHHWRATTFRTTHELLWKFLREIPAKTSLADITRADVEAVLPRLPVHLGQNQHRLCLIHMRAILQHMAENPAWIGPRPAPDLIWREDIPPPSDPQIRAIPYAVLDRLDELIRCAVTDMEVGRQTTILTPTQWDMVIILRQTGMRYADLALLRAPRARDETGCLLQDPTGEWWIHINGEDTKSGVPWRIPIDAQDGVLNAIHRQCARISDIPDEIGKNLLFRQQNRPVMSIGGFSQALTRLAPHLSYGGQPYRLTPHQFRHSIAQDMVMQDIDIVTIQRFLGHRSLRITEYYISLFREQIEGFSERHIAEMYRGSEVPPNIPIAVHNTETLGDPNTWIPGQEGIAYLRKLPNNLGACFQLVGVFPGCTRCDVMNCVRFRSGPAYVPAWHAYIQQLENVLAHELANINGPVRDHVMRELAQAQHIVDTIKKQGGWDGRINTT
jgi:integrase